MALSKRNVNETFATNCAAAPFIGSAGRASKQHVYLQRSHAGILCRGETRRGCEGGLATREGVRLLACIANAVLVDAEDSFSLRQTRRVVHLDDALLTAALTQRQARR